MQDLAVLEKCSRLTDQEILESEKMAIEENPLRLLVGNKLFIKTKDGRLIPLCLNPPQQKLFQKILELRRQRIPVRLVVLKCRQTGVSTETEAIIYALTSQQSNRNSLIMADEEDKANYLFEISKLYQEQLEIHEPHLAPPLKKSNEKKLEWEQLHSQILIEPSRNVDATRAYTYQYAHLSEGAYFKNLAGVLEGLQGVPDHWDTMIIIESTANGYGDEFHKAWESAVKGNTAWVALFLAWFEMPEYTMPLANGKVYPLEGVEFDTDGGMNDFVLEENDLCITHKLSQEQLNWRRWAIVNKCNRKIKTFRREYPSTPDEAFLFTGGCVFDTQKLKRQKEKNIKPLAIGNLVELDNKIVFRSDTEGKFRIFEWFNPITKAVVGADAGEGIGQNASAAVALDRATCNTLMTYHSKNTDTDQFAIDLMKMGKFCNNALVGIESYPSAHGYAVVHDLHKIYGNVFKMIIEDKVTKKQTEKLGWYATKRNIQQALDQFIEEVREDATELRDEILIDECLSYAQDPETGDIGAIEGRNDDMVRARIIAGKLRQLYPASMKYAAHPLHDYGEGIRPKKKKESLTNWSK